MFIFSISEKRFSVSSSLDKLQKSYFIDKDFSDAVKTAPLMFSLRCCDKERKKELVSENFESSFKDTSNIFSENSETINSFVLIKTT